MNDGSSIIEPHGGGGVDDMLLADDRDNLNTF